MAENRGMGLAAQEEAMGIEKKQSVDLLIDRGYYKHQQTAGMNT